MRSEIRFAMLGVAASLTAGFGLPARAQSKPTAPSEARQAAQAIEKALQKHGADVHACFAKVLADRLDSAGKVEIVVEVGKGGKVKSAKVQKLDKSAGPVLAACIEKAALGWTMDGIEAGARVVLPFSFKAQGSQYVINTADVPEHAMGAPQTSKAKVAAPRRGAPFTVKVLADEQNVKAQGISLTMLSVGPASRVMMHRHPHSASILYLVKGHSRLLGLEGTPPLKLEEGEAVFLPAGYPYVIENMGRQSTGVFLQAFSPPGPERVYRDAKDPRGLAEFEVIRDPTKVKTPVASVVSATADEAKPAALPKNAGTSKQLVAGGGMSLALLELADGAELQVAGAHATELYYFLSGGGELKVAGETLPLVAESLAHLPRGTAYGIKAASADKKEKILVLRFGVARPGAAASPAQRK
jgi:mannose-6-phosphate isomerase-like protein (cupin superfamily)